MWALKRKKGNSVSLILQKHHFIVYFKSGIFFSQSISASIAWVFPKSFWRKSSENLFKNVALFNIKPPWGPLGLQIVPSASFIVLNEMSDILVFAIKSLPADIPGIKELKLIWPLNPHLQWILEKEYRDTKRTKRVKIRLKHDGYLWKRKRERKQNNMFFPKF